jgi:sarcosine oxidase delta subunit
MWLRFQVLYETIRHHIPEGSHLQADGCLKNRNVERDTWSEQINSLNTERGKRAESQSVAVKEN